MPAPIPLVETVDPTSRRPEEAGRRDVPVATIEIVFHPDLSRVGERHVLGGVDSDGELSAIVGRDEPVFGKPGSGSATPLLDPCISRQQARIAWSPARSAFRVETVAGARRALELLTLSGERVGAPPLEVPPGTLLAIGDRLLLLLTVRPPDSGPDELGILGQSSAIAALRHRIRAVADGSDSVLVLGETGTGKELVARAIHTMSHRRASPFIALNCAALPEALIESELFGHVRSAFSGASQARPGLFLAAQGGTLFLDEIGEMPLAIQAKLLRVLEVQRVRAVGGTSEELIDVRVVVATHRDLLRGIDEGGFRADLYGRIEAPKVVVPPLRERRDDIASLCAAFLWRRTLELARRLGKSWDETPLAGLWRPADSYAPPLPQRHMLELLAHDWPRNVRELDKHAADIATSFIQRAPAPSVSSPALARPAPTPSAASRPPADPVAEEPAPAEAGRQRPERAELERMLEGMSFNQAELARRLGVPYATLDRWLREVGVVRPKDLTREEIVASWQQTGGDVAAMARVLRVSPKGLKQRLTELGLGGP
jgi:two-component system, NtrC family, nitrogen regulation response regulator GlnG